MRLVLKLPLRQVIRRLVKETLTDKHKLITLAAFGLMNFLKI